METPLLHSKLVAPQLRPNVVTRARLLERLEPNAATKALLVCAPAGFGKTTLIGEWLQRGDFTVAWLSLDAKDNDLRRLLRHLLSALNMAAAPLGETELELLRDAKALSADSLLAPLLNQAATLTRPLCVVLDDYHLITNEAVHETFDFLLEYAPPTVKLCLVTRADPPLKLAKVRARAHLLELRGDDLRFDLSETAAFLKASELELSEDDTKALNERTEGWAVGLQVLALSLAGRQDSHTFIDELTHNNRFLLDYLLDEVFERQPEVVQTFLLQNSILDKFCAALCDALRDPEAAPPNKPSNAAALLDRLERDGLFLRPLDSSRTWFRYHQLFRDVLYHRLSTRYPDLVGPLRKRAASWFAANGYTLDALEQLLAGAFYDEAADLLAAVGPTLMWERGDAATLESWLERLPAAVFGTHPDLLVLRAWTAHLLGNVAVIGPLLDEADLLLGVLQVDHAAALRVESTALRSFLARMNGAFRDALELSGVALRDLPQDAYGLRSLVNGNLGEVYYLLGDLDKAHDFHAAESRLAEKAGAVLPSRFALWRIADIQTLRGELEDAKKTSQTMLNLNKIRSVDALGFADVQLGIVALEQNDLPEAEKRLSVGIELGKRLGNPRVFAPGYGPLAKTLLVSGCPDDAQEILSEGLELSVLHGVGETWGVSPLSAWQAYLDLRSDRLDAAFGWAQQTGLTDLPKTDLAFTRGFTALVVVRILLAKNRPKDALGLLELVSAKPGRTVEVGVLRALALSGRGRQDDALGVLEHAVQVASVNRHVLTFIDEGAALRRLLGDLQAAGRQVAYCTALLGAFPAAEPSRVIPAAVNAESLSERELSVLRLMAGRLSNKEIARELDLSTNTVKWYAKGVFEKLGVHGRLKAASRGRELGLL